MTLTVNSFNNKMKKTSSLGFTLNSEMTGFKKLLTEVTKL